MQAVELTDHRPAGERRQSPARLVAIALSLAAALVALWGGYASHWRWLGINGHTATLWDWLHLLLLLLLPTLIVPRLQPYVAPETETAADHTANPPKDRPADEQRESVSRISSNPPAREEPAPESPNAGAHRP